MMFNATFNNTSIISRRKPEFPQKTTDLSQVTDKHLYTDCTGSYKSNYHAIMNMTVPPPIDATQMS